MGEKLRLLSSVPSYSLLQHMARLQVSPMVLWVAPRPLQRDGGLSRPSTMSKGVGIGGVVTMASLSLVSATPPFLGPLNVY